MKKLTAIILVLSVYTGTAYAADAEIITNGVSFQEANGIMVVRSEMKNNTNVDLKDLKVAIEFRRGSKVVHRLRISVGELEAGKQGKLDMRTESVPERWTNYKLSFYEGTEPLFWRAPKTKK